MIDMAEVLGGLARRIDIGTTVLGGGVLIAEDELVKQKTWYDNVVKNLRHFHNTALPIAIGVVGLFVPRYAMLAKMLILAGMQAIYDAYVAYIAKRPFVVAKDSKTLSLENFDANKTVEVYIDGERVDFGGTPPTTDEAGKAEVTLPSDMTTGVHEVVVIAGKGWVGYVVV